jgi:hypothetical protein
MSVSNIFETLILLNKGDDPLIPIYELIADPVKKAEIKNYVDNYLRENKAYLSE